MEEGSSKSRSKKDKERDKLPQHPIDTEFQDSPTAIFAPLPPSVSSSKSKKTKEKETQQQSKKYTLSSLRVLLNAPDDELRGKGIGEIRAASLPKLVDLLSSTQYATLKYRRTFFLMIPSFSSSEEVALLLFEKITAAVVGSAHVKTGGGEKESKEVKEKASWVVGLLVEWMKGFFNRDWRNNSSLLSSFREFLSSIEPAAEYYKPLSDELKSSLEKSTDLFPSLSQLFPEHEKFGKEELLSLSLKSFTPDEIASSLTDYCFRIFQSVAEREHLDFLLFGEKKDSKYYENIKRLIDIFNSLSRWVGREVVTKLQLKERVFAFEYLVDVATICFDQHNYLACRAILSAVTASYVQRMEKTLQEVSPDTHAKIAELEKKMSLDKNFKELRSVMEATPLPCIPYLGMYQRDLIFLRDGNPDSLHKLINFSKCARIAEIIFDLSACQMGGHSGLSVSPKLVPWISNLPHLSEKDLYLCSRRAEPKDTEMIIAELVQGEEEYKAQITELEALLQQQKEEYELIIQQQKEAIADLRRLVNPDSAGAPLSSLPTPLLPSSSSSKPSAMSPLPPPAPPSLPPPPLPPPISESIPLTLTSSAPLPTTTTTTTTTTKSDLAKEVIEEQGISLSLPQYLLTAHYGTSFNQARQKRRKRGARSDYRKSQYFLSTSTDPYRWAVADVAKWVRKTVGEDWGDIFEENRVLGADLMEMGANELGFFIDSEEVCGQIATAINLMRSQVKNLKRSSPSPASSSPSPASSSPSPASSSPSPASSSPSPASSSPLTLSSSSSPFHPPFSSPSISSPSLLREIRAAGASSMLKDSGSPIIMSTNPPPPLPSRSNSISPSPDGKMIPIRPVRRGSSMKQADG